MNQMTDMKKKSSTFSNSVRISGFRQCLLRIKTKFETDFFLWNCVFKFSCGYYNFDMVYTLLHQIS